MNKRTTKQSQSPTLQPGCYLMSFRPCPADGSLNTYVGTLRITREGKAKNEVISASGDLYEISNIEHIDVDKRMVLANIPGLRVVADRANGTVPIFRVQDYRYYLDIQQVTETNHGATMNLQAHKFDTTTLRITPGTNCRLNLKLDTSPKGQLAAKNQKCFTGELIGTQGKTGDFYFQYLGPKLRRATLRLFALGTKNDDSIDFPGGSSKEDVQRRWRSVFSKAKWDLDVQTAMVSPKEISAPENGAWEPYGLGVNATKLRPPDKVPADAWTYDLLCVSRFENSDYLGMMFDAEATDLNNRPRESAAVAALQELQINSEDAPPKSLPFQKVRGGLLYFRTALHELGHCFNLTHSLTTSTVMDTTDQLLVREATALNGSAKIRFDFAPEDLYWLQHAPDIAVRPGGVSRYKLRWNRRQRSRTTTVLVRSVPGLTLSVQPVNEAIPYGAPARLNIELSNNGDPTFVPTDISLRGGWISGSVIGPDQVTRYFRSAFKCCNSLKPDGRLVKLPSDERKSITDGITLLRGIDTPLFPRPGLYQITLELRWDYHGETRQAVGETSIVVNPLESDDPEQAQAASIALNEPLLMPALVQGRLEGNGVLALAKTLQSKTLAPHYAAIAVRCYDYGIRPPSSLAKWKESIVQAMGNPAKQFGRQEAEASYVIPTSEEMASELANGACRTCREKERLKRYLKDTDDGTPVRQVAGTKKTRLSMAKSNTSRNAKPVPLQRKHNKAGITRRTNSRPKHPNPR